MKPWNSTSLRARLTWRMVAMQALVLMGFSAVVAVPIYLLVKGEQGLDQGIIDDIGDSIQRDGAGGLKLVPDDDLIEEVRDYPTFWFYAVDEGNHSVRMGDVPVQLVPKLDDLSRLLSADIADIGSGESSQAMMRRIDTDVGRLWIITAGGPLAGLKPIFVIFANPVFLSLLTLLTVVSFMVVPIIVTRQLRGVDDVAAEADRIDVDQPGIRLSAAHVPDELHSLVAAINAALQRLDDGIERRQRFLADAAHELRTPIAILQTRIELLPNDEHRSRLMLDIARLANLANQLLDLQRLDADLAVFEPVNLVELAAQVTADMAPLAIAAGDEISFDAETDTVTIQGDAASLSRAVMNLIQNAVIHGGRRTTIRVAVGRDGSLSVADTGPGIAAEYRRAIFEPFNRIMPLNHGAGLGLNLVRDIVLRHNGHIEVGDTPGGGALFEILLPLAEYRTQ